MCTILEHPQAQALLGQATVAPEAVARCGRDLTTFLQRYLPLFYRDEQRDHAATILRGKLTGLQRKTTEPIASLAGQKPPPAALRRRRPLVRLGRPGRAAGSRPRGVGRPAGRAGAGQPRRAQEGGGLLRRRAAVVRPPGQGGQLPGRLLPRLRRRARPRPDRWPPLPAPRAGRRPQHRAKTYVPDEVTFQEGWRIGRDLVRSGGREMPHAWVTGDDEFGRASAFRALLRLDHERYVLDVPGNTLVRDLSSRRPPARPGGKERLPPFERVEVWAARQPKGRWRKFPLSGGEKGPRAVKALQQWVQTKDEGGLVGPRERLVVIRSCERRPRTWYTLSNARQEVPLAQVVAAHGARHAVEELFEEGGQEVGLNHYEVRSWTGWEHHMTLSLLALWFLQVERLRLGGEKSGGDGVAGAGDLHGAAAAAAAEPGGDRGASERGAAA